MASKKSTPKTGLNALQKFLLQNNDVNFKSLSLDDPEQLNELDWKGLKRQKQKILTHLKGYKRLLKLLPYDDRKAILGLIADGVSSALQVAEMPKEKFITKYLHLFDGARDRIEQFHGEALKVKTRVLLQFMASKQK
ncbi:MAG: hypothetical protein J5I94_12320 [Phaeodactylibacter sp.]|nr:hypothetical protein [Phaeodactylibacter sp.]